MPTAEILLLWAAFLLVLCATLSSVLLDAAELVRRMFQRRFSRPPIRAVIRDCAELVETNFQLVEDSMIRVKQKIDILYVGGYEFSDARELDVCTSPHLFCVVMHRGESKVAVRWQNSDNKSIQQTIVPRGALFATAQNDHVVLNSSGPFYVLWYYTNIPDDATQVPGMTDATLDEIINQK